MTKPERQPMPKAKRFALSGLHMTQNSTAQLDLFDFSGTTCLTQPGVELPGVSVALNPPASAVEAIARIGNYYADADRALPPSWKERAAANLEAIRLSETLRRDKRPATRDEQRRLSLFTGFGASDLANGMFRDPTHQGFRQGWESMAQALEDAIDKVDLSALQRSTQYAHFTPERIVRALWAGVMRLGYRGGRVLEPGIGTGLFLSHLPDSVRAGSAFTGIEADPITARICAQIHPDADIREDDFGTSRIPSIFTLAIGNPPYANRTINSDPAYRRMGLKLHDFFIVKALDHVIPGGLAAFVTSQGTMDKSSPRIRQHIAQTSDLVGAIRLPTGTFRATAGTDVGVDILFFRKRFENEDGNGIAWTDIQPVYIPGAPGIEINEYFCDHPEMVLGRHAAEKSQYSADLEYVCKPESSRDLDADLAAAILDLPQDICACAPDILPMPIGGDITIVSNDNHRLREGSYFVAENGALMQIVEGHAKTITVKANRSDPGIFPKHAKLIRALIPIRDSVRAILSKQEARMDATFEQRALGELYDSFVKKFGFINHTDITVRVDEQTQEKTEQHRQPNLSPFRDDPDVWLVASIENYDQEAGTAEKGLIFTGTVIQPEVVPQVRTASDALARSLHEHGHVELGFMARLLNRSEADILEELDTTLYQDPQTEGWLTADEYLSGRVRDKLKAAMTAAETNPLYQRNVLALEQVQPTDIPPSDITARLGAPWIPEMTVTTFINDVMGVKAKVTHVPQIASWSVAKTPFDLDGSVDAKWGTHRYSAHEAITDALNMRIPQIVDEIRDGHGGVTRQLNPKETEAAKEKLSILRQAFEEWVWKDATQADNLSAIYNTTYNNLVARRYDGRHLKMPGASAAFSFYEHQKNAIWRMVCGGTYVAHAVGAGKSATMAAAIMEQRRLGLITKAILTVPGHCLAQCAREFLALYPMAKILVADETNFARDKRRRFLARAATGDWDCIVITHSAFKFIPIPVSFERSMMADMVSQYETIIAGLDANDRTNRKRVEARKETYKARLELLKSRKDDFLTISEIGIDQIIVDEAQEFRKLSFVTNQTSLKGVDPDGSQMAWDLYAKAEFIRHLRQQNSDTRITIDRALHLASGTPITNTLGEMYTVQRFMDHPSLVEREIDQFDAWASTFGETRTELELQPSGRYKPVTRFAEFVNVPELISMFRSFADVVSSDDLERYVKRPAVMTGKRQIITAPPSDRFKSYQKVMDARIKAIEERKGQPEKGDDILLSVITDGRHAAIDLRFVLPGCGDEPENKLNKMIDKIHEIYVASSDRVYLQPNGTPYERRGGTQMVFSDLGTLSVEAKRGFSAYRWIKMRLVQMGVPADEIAFVQDYKNSQAKNRLFADMRAGKIRVTLGSTKKMGTGVNAQNRLIALHHLDVPYLPSDIEQREGRIRRQGNQNEEIGIYAYATEGSMDATMWQMNERKARFIAAALSGDRSIRRLEDVGEDAVNQFAMAKAIASGDPRLMEKAGLESEISRLQRLKDAHYNNQHSLRGRIRDAERAVEYNTELADKLRRDIAARVSADDAFEMVIGSRTFTDRKDAGKALVTMLYDIDNAGQSHTGDGTKRRPIARYRGFKLIYSSRIMAEFSITRLELDTGRLLHDLSTKSNTQGAVALRQVDEAIEKFDELLSRSEGRIAHEKNQIIQMSGLVGLPFSLDGELALKKEKLEEIDKGLRADDEKRAAEEKAEQEALAAAMGGEDTPADEIETLAGEDDVDPDDANPIAARWRISSDTSNVDYNA